MMTKNEIEKQIAVLEILNKEVPFKYPKGSAAFFSPHNRIDTPESGGRYRCTWYDKVGVGFPLKNIVSMPEEWQNLSIEEVYSIAARFDHPLIWGGLAP